MPPSKNSAFVTSDILVLGGGPAGAAAARLLASWGHAVRLITRAAGEPRLAVSIPPSCEKLFGVVGIADAVNRAGFIRSTGNTVWWGTSEARVETFADRGLGWQVDLGALESVMLAEAAAAGVIIERRAVAADEFRNASARRAAFTLDCTGRAGVTARLKNVRRYDADTRTIALTGEWHSTAWPVPDDSHTVIESYADGWMWSVPLAHGIRHVSAMIDPMRSDLERGVGAREVYLAEIAKTRAFRRILASASLRGQPSGWDASTYRAETYSGDDWLLVGDAGSFIDPLSSAGVKKALASAWLAAVAVNTSLNTPSMRADALAFYAAREAEIERHHAAESRAFLAAAGREHDRPFWTTRSADSQNGPNDADAVRRAFDRLKQSDICRMRAGAVRVEPRPMVDGNEIRLAPHLIAADFAPIRYLHGVDMVTLLELAPQATQVPDLFVAYSQRTSRAPLHDFLLALSTAVARGWLVAE